MPDLTTNSLYLTSPFNADPTQKQAAPLYAPFVTQPLPIAGAYAPDNAESTSKISKMTNEQRMRSLYNLHHETVAFTNPADGAVVTIAPDFVAARTHTGAAIYYDRRTGAFDFVENKREIAARADGTIREMEYGNTVTSKPDGSVVAKRHSGHTQTFSADTFDPKKIWCKPAISAKRGRLNSPRRVKSKALANCRRSKAHLRSQQPTF